MDILKIEFTGITKAYVVDTDDGSYSILAMYDVNTNSTEYEAVNVNGYSMSKEVEDQLIEAVIEFEQKMRHKNE